jgi:hypothetical protein
MCRFSGWRDGKRNRPFGVRLRRGGFSLVQQFTGIPASRSWRRR